MVLRRAAALARVTGGLLVSAITVDFFGEHPPTVCRAKSRNGNLRPSQSRQVLTPLLLPAETIWLRNIDQLLRRLAYGNEFQMAGDPRLRKICVLRVVGAIVNNNILEIEGT